MSKLRDPDKIHLFTRKQRLRSKPFRRLIAAAVLSTGYLTAHAATTTIDFNTDPASTGLFEETTGATSAEWRSGGGASGGANDGYLSLTDARDSQRSVLVFKDLENGLVVKSFTFECDLRIGGGNASPADGFSLNYASAADPAITGGDFAGTDAETNLPEEGTQTGLAIGFDCWQSARIGSAQDVTGVSIRVAGQLLAQLPVPLSGTNIYLPTEPLPGSQSPSDYVYDAGTYANLATNDVNYRYSMQTGARNTTADLDGNGTPGESTDAPGDAVDQPAFGDPLWPLWVQNLKWEKFKVEVTDTGKLKIWWKGFEVTPTGGLDTHFAPQAGRLIFGARTGGNNQVQHIDNIVLTTQAYTSVVPGIVRGNASGFHFYVADTGTATVAANGVTLKVEGQTVTPTVVKSGNNTVISYNPASFWPVGKTVTLTGTLRDNAGTITEFQRDFTVGNYATIPADFAVAASKINTGSSGFLSRMHQIAGSRSPALNDANWTALAERQLRNAIIDPATLQPYPNMIANGPATGGTYSSSVINWNQEAGSAEVGHFRSDLADPPYNVADSPIPGITAGADQGDPAVEGYNNNIVAETTAYLDLAAGFYTFGVNSDDGFRLAAVRNAKDVLGVTLGEYSGGRGAGDGTSFDVYVPSAGIYPVRLLWWEGGGGANVELYTLDPVSQGQVLVNDANPLAVKAYATQTTGQRPYVASLSPDRGSQYVLADTNIVITLNDGSLPIDDSTIKMTLNGTSVTPAIANNGAVTTLTRAGGVANLLPAGENTVTLTYGYTDNGSIVNVTNTYSFNVWSYTVIPAGNRVTAVNKANAGFVARVAQMDRTLDGNEGNSDRFPGDGNIMPRPEAQLADALYNPTTNEPYPNLAAPDSDSDFVYNITGPLNFNGGSGGNSGVFNDDTALPGLPGQGTSNSGQNHYVAEFITYLDLKAGAYIMAVNSDDGFVVSSAPDPHDTLGTVLGVVNFGRGNSGLRLPDASLFGVVVPADGIYPIRILYWQGGGGVNVEFLSYDRVTDQAALVGDSNNTRAIPAYHTYTGPARAWVEYSVSPTPWANRTQQAGPGKPIFYGPTPNSADNAGDQFNDSDATRAFADTGIGAVFANGAGKTFGLILNDAPVTPTVTTTGTNTLVVYNPQTPLASGSTNRAGLVYEGTTNYWSWIVGTYVTVPSGLSLPSSAADTTARGLRAKVVKARNDAGLGANTDRAEQQLAGTLIDPATSQPFVNKAAPGPEADGSYIVQTINWNQEVRGGNNVEIGNFRTDSAPGTVKLPDQPIPGIGLATTGEAAGANDSIAAEITAWLDLPAGYIKMGVNSDDGFKVSIAPAGNPDGVLLINDNVGKGASDVPFSFVVPQAGLYPVRLVWYEGGGGANVEFFSYGPNNQKIPINADVTGAIKAYYKVNQTQGLPQITVTRATDGGLLITWTNGGSLEASPVLGTGATWTTVDSDGSFTVAPASPKTFYRVRR